MALLDRARSDLAAGALGRADAALQEHARAFADGALLAEAEVLAIDLLVRRDQIALARTRAAAFLRRYPDSPLAARLRASLPPSSPPSSVTEPQELP